MIIEKASAGTAKATSNVMPLVVAALVIVWNISYGRRAQREGELASRAAGEAPPPMPD